MTSLWIRLPPQCCLCGGNAIQPGWWIGLEAELTGADVSRETEARLLAWTALRSPPTGVKLCRKAGTAAFWQLNSPPAGLRLAYRALCDCCSPLSAAAGLAPPRQRDDPLIPVGSMDSYCGEFLEPGRPVATLCLVAWGHREGYIEVRHRPEPWAIADTARTVRGGWSLFWKRPSHMGLKMHCRQASF